MIYNLRDDPTFAMAPSEAIFPGAESFAPPAAPQGRPVEEDIGDRVLVKARLEWYVGRLLKDEVLKLRRYWYRDEIKPVEAIVVGARTVYSGIRHPSGYTPDSPFGPEEYDAGYLERETSHRALLVTVGLRRKHFLVLTDDAEKVTS